MHRDGARVGEERGVPHRPHQLLAGEHATGVRREVKQQVELQRGEQYVLAVDLDDATCGVDQKVVDLDRGKFGVVLLAGGASQDGVDARDELRREKGFTT